jgi:hypothetical protein
MLNNLKRIETESGLEGYLLRPLSAKLLDPTLIEKSGRIDREKLCDFSGRSRSGLLTLARQWNITDFVPAGGGCLLTDKNFAHRLKDIFGHGYRNAGDIISLRWGRHFRLSEKFKVIVGRDDPENMKLIQYAHINDLIFNLGENPGPAGILKVNEELPSEEILQLCASIIKRFSKFSNKEIDVHCWKKSNPDDVRIFHPASIIDAHLEMLKV